MSKARHAKKDGRVNPDSADADDALCRGVLGWIGTEIFVKWKAADKSGVDTLARLMLMLRAPGGLNHISAGLGQTAEKSSVERLTRLMLMMRPRGEANRSSPALVGWDEIPCQMEDTGRLGRNSDPADADDALSGQARSARTLVDWDRNPLSNGGLRTSWV